MNEEIGYETGEVCNRNRCIGIIVEHESDGSCSCHINPPCSYCTTDRHYCPVCDWQGIDDQRGYGNSTPQQVAYYKSEQESWNAARELFYKKYRGEELVDKLEIRTEPHTHFTQKVFGVFPQGTETKATLLPKITGTFGGRFTHFGGYSFEYIAYTD